MTISELRQQLAKWVTHTKMRIATHRRGPVAGGTITGVSVAATSGEFARNRNKSRRSAVLVRMRHLLRPEPGYRRLSLYARVVPNQHRGACDRDACTGANAGEGALSDRGPGGGRARPWRDGDRDRQRGIDSN